MHTEHVRNVHFGWVTGGWLLAVAILSVTWIVFVGMGLVDPGSRTTGVFMAAAVAVGFFGGGLFVGLRWADAPILHGAAMTFLSVLVWFIGNLLLPGRVSGRDLGLDAPAFVLGVILLQLAAAVTGGWTGRRMMMGGASGAGEEGSDG
ncbi:MAG TPA: hypothetical protein VGA70_02665 [Longimicrobiales bacterium]|jgi:hypothetical protein